MRKAPLEQKVTCDGDLDGDGRHSEGKPDACLYGIPEGDSKEKPMAPTTVILMATRRRQRWRTT
jgi:hypothetical protein